GRSPWCPRSRRRVPRCPCYGSWRFSVPSPPLRQLAWCDRFRKPRCFFPCPFSFFFIGFRYLARLFYGCRGAASFLGRLRHLGSLVAGLREPDGDRLFRVGYLFPAAAAFQLSLFELVHRFLDRVLRLLVVPGHLGPPSGGCAGVTGTAPLPTAPRVCCRGPAHNTPIRARMIKMSRTNPSPPLG